MYIEYDVTEQDFVHAQQLVHRISNSGFMRRAEFASPFLGFVLAAFLIYLVFTKGVSVLLILGLGLSLYLILILILSRRLLQKLYRQSEDLHGKLFLDVDSDGFRFGGEKGSVKTDWKSFGRCVEDYLGFVFLRKGRVVQVVPKRCLTASQLQEFRQCLKRFSR